MLARTQECRSNPCTAPQGTCYESSYTTAPFDAVPFGSYVCDCATGWSGDHCDVDIDECLPEFGNGTVHCAGLHSECHESGADVSVALGVYECSCTVGWSGTPPLECSIDVNECQPSPCRHSSTCAESTTDSAIAPGNYTCNCSESIGRTGVNCEDDIDECTAGLSACQNGATCLDSSDSATVALATFRCECAAGWQDIFCNVDTDECLEAPCAYGGACRDSTDDASIEIADFECSCPIGRGSRDCSSDVDECLSVPCQHDGNCTDSNNDTAIALDRYICECSAGYSGSNCAADVDECRSNPCLHDGSICHDSNNTNRTDIVVSIDAFYCQCATGWEGSRCLSDIDDCASLPCNAGNCTDRLNSFECDCETGYEGDRCQFSRNPCLLEVPVPCASFSNASCVHTGPSMYRCDCMAGYNSTRSGVAAATTDPVCTDLNECLAVPCANGGVCSESGTDAFIEPTNYTCACVAGFVGTNCEIDFDECVSAPCHNGVCFESGRSAAVAAECGDTAVVDDYLLCDFIHSSAVYRHTAISQVCQNSTDVCTVVSYASYVCLCLGGWSGSDCDTDIDECASTPCTNGAACHESNSSTVPTSTSIYWSTMTTNVSVDMDAYRCLCVPGTGGLHCADDIDECTSAPCMNGAVCIESHNSTVLALGVYNCNCTAGWDGENCADDIDECTSMPCLNNATCSDGIDSYNCSCVAGFNGTDCQINVQECESRPCSNGGVCIDAIDAYVCSCSVGWHGHNCADDVDECQSNPCQHDGHCVESQISRWSTLSFALSDARARDAINDTIVAFNCTVGRLLRYADFALEFHDPGGPYAAFEQWNCSVPINIDTYSCSCTPGWTGAVCQIDIDECLSMPCQNSGNCSDGEDIFDCRCPAGWSGELCTVDVDECESSPCSLFSNHSNCSHSIDAYMCNCTAGWQGENCAIDFDECHSDPCMNAGVCNASSPTVPIDTFACGCVQGWEGHRCEVDSNECESSPCLNGNVCVESVRVSPTEYFCFLFFLSFEKKNA